MYTANINSYHSSATNKTSSSSSSVNKKAGSSTLDSSDFLQLLAAQLANQDVSNPTDSTQFISQMAQFTSLQAMQTLSETANKQYGASLVGKKVMVSSTDTSGRTIVDQGIVSSMQHTSTANTLTINGKNYDLSTVVKVLNNVSTGKYYSSAGGATIYLGTAGKSISDYSIGIQYKDNAADTTKTVGVVADTGKKQIMVTLDATGGTDKLPTMTDLEKVLQGTWTWQQTTGDQVTPATAPTDFDPKMISVSQAGDDTTKTNTVQQAASSPISELDS